MHFRIRILNANKRNDALLQIIFLLAAFLDENGFDETLFQALYSLYRDKKELDKSCWLYQYEKKYGHKNQLVTFLGNFKP
jgi:hypothetical protein